MRNHPSALIRLAFPCVVALPGLLSAQWPRGGWLEQDWTYLYEARFDDGAPDGLGIVGVAGGFSSLDGGWDYSNPAAAWLGDLIDDDGIPGGAEMMAGDGDGDNESGIPAEDAETLGILDPAGLPVSNSRIYFERFLTDDLAGAGQPVIDFDAGVTVIARFRFFSIDRLKSDTELQTRLGLSPMDVTALGTGEIVDASEYDESPRESFFNQKGMFMVTRRDVYEPNQQAGIPGVGGIYFGVANDGDDSWDPSNQIEPSSPAQPVDVKIAYILGGPENQNFAFQGSADSRLIDSLRARGARVTILDDTGPQGHQFYQSTDPGYAGAPGPDAVAHDFDLVLISSTVGSAGVATDNDNDGIVDDPDLGYRFRPVPYVCWENGLGRKGYAWMANPADPQQGGFVIGTPPTGTRSRIEIVNNTHPITEGLDLGEVEVFHSPQRMSALTDPFFGTVAPGVTVLARNPADNFSALAVLCVADPDGGNLGDGDVPAARQVFFFFEDESAVAMNPTGQLLFDRAVEWALGDAKAALLGPSPPLPEPPAETIPSFYLNLGATPAIEAAGLPFTTRVLRGAFLRDYSSAEATVPTLGGDTRVWAPLPAGTSEDFVSVYITIAPEAGVGGGGQVAAPPRMRVKVYFDGSTEPAIEIQDHHLDPDILPAIALTEDGSGPNDGTGLGMGLWRDRAGGHLDVDYFGVLDSAVDPSVSQGGIQRPADENQDGAFNLSDPISILNHLFAGSNPTLPCGDGTVNHAANQALLDLNGDDAINLSDPIFGLNFLFVGGASPLPVNCTDASCPCIPIVGCPNDPSGACAP